MIQFLKVCLWTQVFSLILAFVAFGVFADPRTAGSLTGPVFLLSGALPALGLIAKRITVRQVSFWVSVLFTVFFSGPMLIKRFALYGRPFSEITYYGISSGMFHRLSSLAYLILFGCLIWDLFCAKQKKPAC